MTSVRLREWQRTGPKDEPALRGVRLRTPAARKLAERLSVSGVLGIVELWDGLELSARAHVGRIQLDDVTVTIEPKIGRRDFLTLLRYAYGLRDVKVYEDATFSATGDLLQDLLAMQLRDDVTELLGRGLARD